MQIGQDSPKPLRNGILAGKSHPDQTVERIPPMQFQDDEGIVSK